MTTHVLPDAVDTVVIGAGQSGLAAGYHLTQRGVDVVILDANDEIGASWRDRWDSLRLFTPSHYSSLPGMPFPAPRWSIPHKDDVADYFAVYASTFELPVRTGVVVDRVGAVGDRYVVDTTDGRIVACNVVVATGAFHHPRVPEFARGLDDAIMQIHSSDYRRPSQVPDGDVLVVGAGSSGAEIALELSAEHRVWLSGRDPGQEPTTPGSKPDRLVTPIVWFLANRVIDVRNPLGRRVRSHFLDPPRGIPRGRVTKRAIDAAGLDWVGRTVGVDDGFPALDDGTVFAVRTVVWCTGFRADFGWVDLPVFGDDGYPIHARGVVESQPGLYFMGLPFQTTLSSALIGGVGRDAAHIARHIRGRERSSAVLSPVDGAQRQERIADVG